MTNQGKDFSVLKWIVFPLITIGLAAGIAIFNVRLFGWADSAIYLIALTAVNIVSLILLKFSGSSKRPVRMASYIFECLLIGVLLINAAYSLSAQRDLSLVRQSGVDRREEIEQIGKLRSARAQRELAGKVGERADARSAFARFEAILFWVMVAELGLSLGGLVLVYGLAAIKPGLRKVPRGGFRGVRAVGSAEAVGAFKGIVAAERGAQIGFAPLKPPEARVKHPEASSDSGCFRESWPGQHPQGALAGELRVIGQDSGVRVYSASDYLGHVAWPRYLASVVDPQRPTEGEIRALLLFSRARE